MRIALPQTDGQREALLRWVGRRIPHAPNLHLEPHAVPLGVVTDGEEIAACVVFTNYIPADGTIQVHLAACNPLWTRGTIVRDILGYPFNQLGCSKVWGATPIDMVHVLQVNRKMGFTREAVLRYHIQGKHAVITGLLRKEYLRKYWPERTRVAA